MSGVAQVVLGYSFRLDPGLLKGGRWDPARRATYLLADSVETPLSTDEAVWPSAIPDAITGGLTERWLRPLAPLWLEMVALRGLLADLDPEARKQGIIAAFSVSPKDLERIEGELELSCIVADPSALESNWDFLGFDVSDSSQVSGLMNCGYLDADAKRMEEQRWGGRLNSHHLFEHLSDARSFANLTNIRVSEHAPFFPYGVWQLCRA